MDFKMTVSSWMGCFKQNTYYHIVNTQQGLRHIFEKYSGRDIKITGRRHSYNKASFAKIMVELGSGFSQIIYNSVNNTCYVGAAVTIEEVMIDLVQQERRLINSGNHRAQTYVGAALTGTHGYGANATIADQIISFDALVWENNRYSYMFDLDPMYLNNKDVKAVIGVTIITAPLTAYKVTSCVCRLDDLKSHDPKKKMRSYAVLPYSSNKNPVCIISDYEPTPEVYATEKPVWLKNRVDRNPNFKLPLSWWKLKVWWLVDGWCPPLRRFIQWGINYVKMKPYRYVVNRFDIDGQYHPFEGLDGKQFGDDSNPIFKLWAYKPTFTCFNISLFVKPEYAKDFILELIFQARKIDKNLLRCFIGVRELIDKSNVEFAGNSSGPVSAIDFYCSPRKYLKLIKLQQVMQKRFDTKSHLGKTVEIKE
jgi:hypothetical protein